ncbi:MAG: hypothetical protein V4585_22175 [Bacteroidota bacterium]
MKTYFTKFPLGIIAILCFMLNSEMCLSQWIQPLGNNGSVGALKVTSTGGSVAGNNAYYGSAFYGTNDVTQAANNGWIATTFNSTAPGLCFKATAGKPVTITIEIAINSFGEITNYISLPGGIGKNEQNYAYDAYVNIPFTNFNNDPRIYTYTGTFTFAKARSQEWLVFGFEILQNGALQQYTMVLPFIVDGVKEPNVPLVLNSTGQPSIITQPELPITVLHAPPGDQSYTRFEINKTACQSVENSITEDLANSGNGAIKLGYKGSAAFGLIDIEAYVEFTSSGTEGNSSVKIKNNETCISSTTGFGATPGSGEDIFLCEGLDYNYAVYEQLFINPAANNYSTYTKSGLAMVPIDGTKRLNLFTRTNIVDQIELRRLDTLNTSLPLKQRIDAKNQLNVWKQLITLNDINVANATIPNPDYGLINLNGGAPYLDRTTSVSTNQTNTLIVDHYIESNTGLQGVVNIGGSGFSAGYNLRTSKSYGQTNSTTSSNTQTMTMHLEDNDAGDLLNINIYRDPMFGTPLFKLQTGSKTSCPFEGGYQRDQPKFKILGTTKSDTTISNVSLGTAGNFKVKVCNDNATETRTYSLGFIGQTNASDLQISAAGSSGVPVPNTTITKFGSFSVSPMTCRVEDYDVNISRKFPTSLMSFSNLEFQLYSECEPTIKKSIFVNINFAGPPPPSNVSVSSTSICQGSPVILSATCAATTTPTWYTVAVGGFPLGTGTTLSVTPTAASTTYYIGCETVNYQRDRVATSPVVVKPIPTIQTFSSTQTICIGTTATLSATCSVGSNPVWYTSNIATIGTAGATFTSPLLSASTTYFVACETGGTSNCVSTRQQIVVNVNPVSPVPIPQPSAYIAVGGSVSLTATGCSGGSGTYALKWYKALDNSLVTMPVSPSTTTNYYAKCEQTLNGITCTSANSGNVLVNVGDFVNSVLTGNWESTNTWFPSRIPLATDNVIINNHTVTITSNAANAKSVDYKTGATLKYLNAGTKLKVGF